MEARQRLDQGGVAVLIFTTTFVVFFFLWAAAHDIARGDNGIEWVVLFACAPAFLLLDGLVWRSMSRRLQIYWFAGVGFLMALVDLASASALLRPKYPMDLLLGRWLLSIGLPVLALIGWQLLTKICGSRSPRHV